MLSKIFQKALIIPIRIYQIFISPLLGKKCRFLPTCSEYSIEAIKAHGPIHGLYLVFKRLFKCHPFCEGGVDEVPPIIKVVQGDIKKF